MDLTPVVISAPTGKWDLSTLIPTDGRPCWIASTREWEITHLRQASDMFDRFAFLKESCRVLDRGRFWADVDSYDAAWIIARPACYLGIYWSRDIRRALDDDGLRSILNGRTVEQKRDSIDLELRIGRRVRWLKDYPTIYPDITEKAAKRIEAGPDGEPEYVIGNAVFEKFKGTAGCRVCYNRATLTGPPGTSSGICRHRVAQADAVAAGMSMEDSYALLTGD